MAERAIGTAPEGLDVANPGFNIGNILEKVRLPDPKAVGRAVRIVAVAGGAVLGALGLAADKDAEPVATVDIAKSTADANLELSQDAQEGLALTYGENCPDAWAPYAEGGDFSRGLDDQERAQDFVTDAPAACTPPEGQTLRSTFWAFEHADDLVTANQDVVDELPPPRSDEDDSDLPLDLDALELALYGAGALFLGANGKLAGEAKKLTAKSNANKVEDTLTQTITTNGVAVKVDTDREITRPSEPDARAAARTLMESTAAIPDPLPRAT